MGLSTIFFLAVGLSMDAFAVSISSGAKTKYRLVQNALVIALFFGAFQALMPVLGWLAGCSLRDLISSYDHWVAFGLLTILGCKMIYESISGADEGEVKNETLSLTFRLLLTLSIATSIDALAVGISFSVLKASIVLPIIIIGLVTFLISGVGVLIGHKFGSLFGKKFELIGGLILIAIGIKILLVHTIPSLAGSLF